MPSTGELRRLPDDEGLGVVVFHAEPGSPSDAALQLLVHQSADRADQPGEVVPMIEKLAPCGSVIMAIRP
jgi:hypothetical protein